MIRQVRLAGIIGVIALAFCMLAGLCASFAAYAYADNAPAATEATASQADQAQAAAPQAEPRTYPYTFTDMAGIEITLKDQVKTVYIVGNVQPLVALYRYYAGNSDNLIECPGASQSIIKSSVFAEIWPDMLELKAHNDDANVEEILALNPDVIFMTGSATGDKYEALVNAGLTVVSFPTAGSGDDNDTFATVENWLNQMGEVFGDAGAASALIEYNKAVLDKFDTALADVKDTEKPSALIIFQLTDNSCKVAGSGHYSEFWLDHSGAINAAADLSKLQEVDIEQLMAWDPDIIYITTFSPAMPEDLYNNTIEGFDFSMLSAVKNHQVYKIPLGSYRWYAPSCECALMLEWLAIHNYPELFADLDMNADVTSFIEKFYGVTPTADQVNALLNPSDTTLMSH
ncbi:MAG: ABC transporter substrate-binding protein [Coriobacteriales bacterium]|nr:ABC transporter substrate-binding protein [Coriobacteriales bacterium]